MTTPSESSQLLPDLETEIDLELHNTASSSTTVDAGPQEWLFDPVETEREEIGLRNILGAVWALEEPRPRDEGR